MKLASKKKISPTTKSLVEKLKKIQSNQPILPKKKKKSLKKFESKQIYELNYLVILSNSSYEFHQNQPSQQNKDEFFDEFFDVIH